MTHFLTIHTHMYTPASFSCLLMEKYNIYIIIFLLKKCRYHFNFLK